MERKLRSKMPASERAKQFMPFSALRGLSEALKQKEIRLVPQVELTEFGMEQLDQKLNRLRPGMRVSVTYYRQDEHGCGGYRQIAGLLSAIEQTTQLLTIAGQRIGFSAIRDISLLADLFSPS